MTPTQLLFQLPRLLSRASCCLMLALASGAGAMYFDSEATLDNDITILR